MPISPINFKGGTYAGNFNDLISQPQAFPDTQSPIASTSMADSYDGQKKEGSLLKKILVGSGIVVAASALLIKGKRSNWFEKTGEDGILNTVKGGLQSAGETLDNQWTKLKNFFKGTENSESKTPGKSGKSDNKPTEKADGKTAEKADGKTDSDPENKK